MRTLKIHCGTVTAAIACCLLSGCAVYLDNPPKQTFRGQVLFKDTPIPVAESRVSVWSPRRYLVLPPLPVDGLAIVGHPPEAQRLIQQSAVTLRGLHRPGHW